MGTFLMSIVGIVVLSIISLLMKYYDNRKNKKARDGREVRNYNYRCEVSQIASDTGYLKIRDMCMSNLFGNKNLYSTLKVSSNLVNNFDNSNLNYLIKYFDMKIDDNTMNYLIQLENFTYRVMKIMNDKNIPQEFGNCVFPVFTMKYESPAGRSTRQSRVVFDYDTVHNIRIKVESMTDRKNFAKHQRSRMTAELREYIKRRDNYTCQICGNSIYKEPNLLLEVDHIHPVSAGGETDPDNLWTLCWRCNRKKSNNIL